MKLTTCFRIALVVLCALALEMTAWAQSGSISDGNATFEFNGSAFTHGSADFSDGDVDGGSDNVFQNWWWYRITGENMETPFPSLVDGLGPDSENYAGDTATLDWNSSIPLFDATLSINIGDFGAGTPGAGVTETMVITNTSTLSYELNVFNYLDANVGGTAGGDSASLLPQARWQCSTTRTTQVFCFSDLGQLLIGLSRSQTCEMRCWMVWPTTFRTRVCHSVPAILPARINGPCH